MSALPVTSWNVHVRLWFLASARDVVGVFVFAALPTVCMAVAAVFSIHAVETIGASHFLKFSSVRFKETMCVACSLFPVSSKVRSFLQL